MSSKIYGQHEYAYALDIQKSVEEIKKNKFQYRTLAKFIDAPLANNGISSEEIINEFNNFLNNTKSSNDQETYTTQGSRRSPKNILSNSIVGGLSQENFIIAFTDVIIDRAKEELALAYFDRTAIKMREKNLSLNLNCYVAEKTSISELFPHFYLLAKNSRASLNLNFGNTLLSAFQNDLNGMYSRVDKKLIPECYKQKSSYSIQDASYNFYQNLKKGISLEKSLSLLAPDKKINSDPKNLNVADHYLNLLAACSKSLMQIDQNKWIDTENETLNAFGKEVYLGLLYKNKNYKDSFEKLGFNGVKKNDAAYVNFIFNLTERYKSIKSKIEKGTVNFFSTKDSYESNNAKAVSSPALEVAIDLILIVEDFSQLPNIENFEIYKGAKTARHIIDFYKGVGNNHYGECALAILMILDILSENDANIPTELLKYITLAADISQAQNSEAAKVILENAILPVGSYKVKRTVRFSASLNSYLGINGGFEFLDEPKRFNSRSFYIGPFLPVGIDLSLSNGTEDEMRGSTSLFISAFDFGTVAGYRFRTEVEEMNGYQVERFSNLKFQHFLSPGIFIIRGLEKAPVSFGIGGQYTPRLRKIKSLNTEGLEFDATSFRITAFMSIDIPLLNIAMKGRKKLNSKNNDDFKNKLWYGNQ